MSQENKNITNKQHVKADENIAKILNQVIAMLNSVKLQAQTLYEKKVSVSMRGKLKQALQQASDSVKKVSNSCTNCKQASAVKAKKGDKAGK